MGTVRTMGTTGTLGSMGTMENGKTFNKNFNESREMSTGIVEPIGPIT